MLYNFLPFEHNFCVFIVLVGTTNCCYVKCGLFQIKHIYKHKLNIDFVKCNINKNYKEYTQLTIRKIIHKKRYSFLQNLIVEYRGKFPKSSKPTSNHSKNVQYLLQKSRDISQHGPHFVACFFFVVTAFACSKRCLST